MCMWGLDNIKGVGEDSGKGSGIVVKIEILLL